MSLDEWLNELQSSESLIINEYSKRGVEGGGIHRRRIMGNQRCQTNHDDTITRRSTVDDVSSGQLRPRGLIDPDITDREVQPLELRLLPVRVPFLGRIR